MFFFIIIIKDFSCEHLQEREFRGKFCKIANVFMDDTLQELVNGKKEFGEQIRGVVYFEGFDFPNYVSYFVSIYTENFTGSYNSLTILS